jgi:GNAT superfamily N-acetyltransferase
MQVDEDLSSLLPLVNPCVFERLKGSVDHDKRTVNLDIIIVKPSWRGKGIGTSVVVSLLTHELVDYVQVKDCVNWSFWKRFRNLSVGPVVFGRHSPSLLLAGERVLCQLANTTRH